MIFHSRRRMKPRDVVHARAICPGGVGFETSSASGGWGAVLVANAPRPVLHGVSVRLIGNGLGLQISKPDDKQVNENWEISPYLSGDFLCAQAVSKAVAKIILKVKSGVVVAPAFLNYEF